MRAYRFAAIAILLAIPSNALGQTFDPNAPRETNLAIRVRFGAAGAPATAAPPREPAAPVRFNLPTLKTTLALPAGPGPCADARAQAQARADADKVARYLANDRFGMNVRPQRNWEAVAELVGGLVADFAFPGSASGPDPRSLADRTLFTTAGTGGPPLPGSALGCPPAKNSPIRRAPADR